MHRPIALLACAALVAGCGSDALKAEPRTPELQKRALAGAPPPLARLHRQSNRLLGGGPKAFRARLRELRGHPVVVNKWASWCPPCRAEFTFFERQSLKRGREIAFVGVDANDNDADARKFLRVLPVSYPSYKDPDLGISAIFN